MSVLFKRGLNLFLKNKLLILIFVLAAAGRLILLTYAPPALNWDEVSHGYNAFSILKTGSDEWGKLLPLSNFRAYGDYPLPLNLYITIPFIAIFGLNEFSIRLPHALLGSLTPVAAYALFWGLTKSKRISLLGAFLVAVEPWGFFLSRFVVQSNLSVFFLTASLAAFFNRHKNAYLLPLAVLFLGLTLYSYHTTRIVAPLLLIFGYLIYRKSIHELFQKHTKIKILSIVTLLIFFVPLPFILLRPEAYARSKFTFILNEGAISKIAELRQKSQLPETFKRLVYNRPTYFVNKFLGNYVSYFSYKFLFVEGGTQYQFSVPGKGLLYPVGLPFFYLGSLLIIRKAIKGESDYGFILAWLVLAPIPAALTNEVNAVVRATTMLPLPMLATAVGFVSVSEWVRSKIKLGSTLPLFIIYVVILALFAQSYLRVYFTEYRRNYSWSWQYGYREAVEYAKENYQKYDKIIVTKKYGEPHEFFIFYWPWDPAKYKSDPNLIRFYQSGWYWVDRFDKFYFVNDWQIPKSGVTFLLESKDEVDCSKLSCLLITSPNNYPEGWGKLYTINYLDGNPAFEVLDNQAIYSLR